MRRRYRPLNRHLKTTWHRGSGVEIVTRVRTGSGRAQGLKRMYEVDEKDHVVELEGVQSSVGAPIPVLISEDGKVVLAFYLQNTPDGWDGTTVRIMNSDSEESLAIVEFSSCYAHMFGPPNDEAFDGHPLAGRGLKPYGAYEVLNSLLAPTARTNELGSRASQTGKVLEASSLHFCLPRLDIRVRSGRL